jgi:hypothetical protein
MMMRSFILAVLAAATSTSAFSVNTIPSHDCRRASSSTTTTALSALGDIMQTLSTLEGPSICWGPEGTLQGYDELEVREYDNFRFFKSALEQNDLTKVLKSTGPFTLLAPVDSAFLTYDGEFSLELLKHHIIVGDVFSDEFTGDFETLNGDILHTRHEFRKIYVDEALIGQLDNHTGGSKYPTNVQCDNGIIHAINIVLIPGYQAPKMVPCRGVPRQANRY